MAAESFFHVTEDGRLQIAFHPGQLRAWDSLKRFILVLAGWQSGKTVIGPPWLRREIEQRGPGDYLVASPTYPLMQKKVLPEFLYFFDKLFRLGEGKGHGWNGSKNVYTFSPAGEKCMFGRASDRPTQVFFGHAGDPDSLESATYKGAWLDECGQRGFPVASWEAVLGRLAIHQGRALLTTRPYNLGWIKSRLYDPWLKAGRNHPHIEVVNFRSIDNPAFPPAEYYARKKDMPAWLFAMKYRGELTRPAGAIYDCFEEGVQTCPRFAVPEHWPRYCGLDFGGVNTAAVFLAEEAQERPGPVRPHQMPLCPALTGKLYAYRAYGPCGSRTARQHAESLLAGEPCRPTCVGGSASEGQWRQEFAAAGLPVLAPPIKEVEVGIQRVYGALARGELVIMDDLRELCDDLSSYSRETDEQGNVLEAIADKETWHRLDALRYVVSHLKGGVMPAGSFKLERV